MIAGVVLRHVPILRGFGITAILSGIERKSLRLLDGSSLSGELRQPVHLHIAPSSDAERENKVEYRLAIGRNTIGNRLVSGLRYG